MGDEKCPVCGGAVRIVSSGEGTSCYVPTIENPDRFLKMFGFGKAFWLWFIDHYRREEFPFDEDSEEVMKIAEGFGLVRREAYDPEKHGDEFTEYLDVGDEIWWWGNPESGVAS